MVFVAKAIVHKGTVVVEALDTLIAVVAMHGVLRSKVFALNTHIVQVQLFLDQALH